MKKPVIVFDMNETLLDMSALDSTFGRIFGDAEGAELRKKWFRQVLELFLTATIVAEYRSFDKLTDDALRMLAAQRGTEATAAHRAMLTEAQGQIPAHRDVRPGLQRLEAAGFTLATLTNSTKKSATKLLQHAKLDELFHRVLSADDVRSYKPAPEPYMHAARELNVKPGDVLLVAAHAWDIAGALAAGCRAAFVERPEKALNPATPEPEITARDVTDLAGQIIAKYG
ncbi:MAG: haloacid dehalogenase type II [Gemmatimonadaceae bacterium]